jgi:hypothetical protein
MGRRPGLTAVIDQPLAQQQLGRPVQRSSIGVQSSRAFTTSCAASCSTERTVASTISLTRTNGQTPAITGIGFHPNPRPRAPASTARPPHTQSPRRQRPGQPEPRRTGLVGHGHRLWQCPDPLGDLAMIRGQPALTYLTALSIDSTRRTDRACTQLDTRKLP